MNSSRVFDTKYKQLNAKQKEAVDTIYGPVMVVAGPGTGKTTVLTLRIANILDKASGAKPEEILALTFTENGARNMREKLREIIGDASFRVNIFTFHAFANHMRSLFPECFGKTGDRQPSDEATKLQILESILEKQSFKELRVSTFGINLKKISGRISDLKREIIGPKDLEKLIKEEARKNEEWKSSIEKINKTREIEIERKEKYITRLTEFCTLYELYEKDLEKRALYDFDDGILELIKALKANPDMAADMRESFQFVLADEHQDANGAQNEILKMFKAEGLESPNVFVVGDDKQSIFRFQGASLDHFYEFAEEFEGAKKIVLTENYRSHRVILEAGHSLIAKDGREHQKLSANVNYEEKKIEITEYLEYEQELYATAKKVKQILERRGDLENVAIISRNNKAIFDIAGYLDLEGVQYKIAGERSLFEDPEYRKLLYLLKAISNPYDGALLKALYAGYFGVDTAEIIQMANQAKNERKDFASIFLSTGEGSKVKDLITKAKKVGVIDFLKEIKSEINSNIGAEFDALRAVFDEARILTKANRAAVLDDLLSHLAFLEKHSLSTLNSDSKTSAKVELFSIHRSKGLEFDNVFIVDVTAKRFEKSGGRADLLRIPNIGVDTELEEERRLLYVALTRAKRHASISYALTGDDGADNAPSVLLSEISDEYADRSQDKGKLDKPDMLSVAKNITKDKKQVYREAFLSRNFSVSALNNFLECPWRYFFRNLLLVPEAPEFAASLGNASHNALRIFHTGVKKGKVFSKKELKDLVAQCVLAEPFTESELSVAEEKIEKSIFAYTDSFADFAESEKVLVEDSQSFVYKLEEGKINFEITVTGKIDLSREISGKVNVIDFKTKKRMTRNEIKGETKNSTGNEWRQLQFYKFLLENTKKDVCVNVGTLTFLSPERGEVLSEVFALEEEDKASIEKALSQALLSIYNLDFWNTTCESKDCEYCGLSRLLSR